MSYDNVSFSFFADAPASVQAEVPKKILCGIQTCQYLLTVVRDTHDIFSSVAKKAKALRSHTEILAPTITSSTGTTDSLFWGTPSIRVVGRRSALSERACVFVFAGVRMPPPLCLLTKRLFLQERCPGF